MGRRARSFYPGVPTHITARGIDDQPIFLSDLDRYELLALLRKATERAEWQVLAWCLMTTHYHLLVVVPEDPRVSWAMQTVNSVYAREFNCRHRRPRACLRRALRGQARRVGPAREAHDRLHPREPGPSRNREEGRGLSVVGPRDAAAS